MAFRPFITSLLGLDGTPESGGLLRSVVKGTSTPLPLYSDSAGAVPLTNPVVATSLGTIVCYFNDTLEYSWQAKTADNATTLWEANVVSGVLSLTYVNPEYSEHPIIEASWVPALGTPLGTGWPAAFAQDIDEILDDAKGIRVCATYAEMTALTADELTDNRVYCTYARAAEEDGGFGFWRYDSGSSATANGGTVLAIDGGGAGRFFRLIESEICVSWFTDGNASGTAQASLTDVSTAMRAFFAECYSTGLMGKLNRGKRTYAVSQDASTGYCLADGGISLEGCASPDSDFCPQIVPMTGVGSSVDIVRRTPVTGTIDRPIWRNVRINQLYSGSPLGRHAVYAHYTNDSESLLTEYTENRFDGGNSYALKTVGVGATNPQGVPFAPVIERNYFGTGLWTEDVGDSSKINGNVIRRSGNLYAWYYSPVDDIFGIPQKAHFHQNNIDGPVYLAKGYGIEIAWLDQEISTGTNDAALTIAAPCEDTTIIGWTFGAFGTASLGAVLDNYGTRTILKAFRIDTAPTGGGFTAPPIGIRNRSGGSMTIELDGSYLRSGRFGADIQDDVTGGGITYVSATRRGAAYRTSAQDVWMLSKNGAAASVTGTTAETALRTITVPGGMMGANGMVRVRTLWSITNSGNNKTIRIRIGGLAGTAIMGNALTTQATIADERVFHNRNSQASQVAASIGNIGVGGWGQTTSAVTTATINTANDFDIAITGELANTGETITLESYSVEVIYGA